MPKETIVIDIGGSIVSPAPGKINYRLLAKIKNILRKNQQARFIIVVGGGGLCRVYQREAIKNGVRDNFALDWLGIRSTQLNAEIFRAYLGNIASRSILTSEKQKINLRDKVIVSGGWRPGNSTDYIAAQLAVRTCAKKIIIATNIDYLYDKDPKKFERAKIIKKASWDKFREIIDKKWTPGMATPLDPKATALCARKKISALFLNGKNMANLEKAIRGKSFRGTTIS